MYACGNVNFDHLFLESDSMLVIDKIKRVYPFESLTPLWGIFLMEIEIPIFEDIYIRISTITMLVVVKT